MSSLTALKDINAALTLGYQNSGIDIPTAYIGSDYKPTGASFAELHLLPADRYPSTLGEIGQDRMLGIFQVDFNVTENSGSKELFAMVDLICTYFKAGLIIPYGFHSVRIRRAVPSPMGRSEKIAGSVMSVSVYWQAEVERGGVEFPELPPGYSYSAGSSTGEIQLDYEFSQPTPSALWIINHNLGRKVTTDVYNTGGVKVWGDVINISDNQVHVAFETPMAGYAIIN